MNHLIDYRDILEALATRLTAESADWVPTQMHARQELRRCEAMQASLLWNMALAGGSIILHLAVQRRLDLLPRLQTRALQARSELRRHVEEGKPAYDVWPAGPREGFDLLVVQLFDDCCRTWLHSKQRRNWFGREPEVATTYARFMNELAKHLPEAIT